MELSASDFDEFFKEVYGHPPFKWQSELALQVCEKGWPKALDMPTSSGKTAVIDIAVFHLALEAKKDNRKAPIRIAFVVDRRLVVDDAFDRARCLSREILKSEKPKTKKVRDALKSISSQDKPLEVVKIRGGIPREGDWAKTPAQPLVIISTVDQVGSRLLFRGYGISASMRPIHAGLLGSDTLFLLDEAHTSQPFWSTLDKIQDMRKTLWPKGSSRPFHTMFMSATLLPEQRESVFPPKDRRQELLSGDERIKKRIECHKYAKLVETKTTDERDKEFINSALEFSKSDAVKNIGIIVNSVFVARELFSLMKKKLGKEEDMDVHLLIGRSRPFDRDTYIKNKIMQIKKTNNDEVKKVFFVSTQCVEVGVDISFDAMVTEIAPLDSLRQRFGRLNRTGLYDESQAKIIASNDKGSCDVREYIYKKAPKETLAYLKKIEKKGKLDFGIKYFSDPDPEDMEKLIAPKADFVDILPTYLDFLTQTKPPPYPELSPEIFLHGLGAKTADVQIIWRADIAEDYVGYESTFASLPSSLEAVSVPIWTAKKWLVEEDNSDKSDAYVSDIEGVSERREDKLKKQRQVLRWRGKKDKNTMLIEAKDIRPGDTMIVPATYGGCDVYGWNNKGTEKVSDIGTEVNIIHRKYITLRFNKAIISDGQVWESVEKATIKHAESDDIEEFFTELLDIENLPEQFKVMLEILQKDKDGKKSFEITKTTNKNIPRTTGLKYLKKISDEQIRQIFSKWDPYQETYQSMKPEGEYAEASTEEDEDEGSKEIQLSEHCKGVKEFVKKFGSKIKLDQTLLKDMEIAAMLHDAGKAEKRVQAFYLRKDPDEMDDHIPDEKLLAKTTYNIKNRNEYDACRKKARLPKGYRHECWSVSLARQSSDIKEANDEDLVMYLIGTHHGRGRPLFPAIADKQQVVEIAFNKTTVKIDYNLSRLDSYWIDIIKRIYKKYDPWELAYLEGIIRLADHCQSKMEKNG